MGLWASFKNALGFVPALVVEEPGAFALTEAGQAAVDALPDGSILRIRTMPAELGRIVRADVEAPEPGLETLAPRVLAEAAEVDHLTGLLLDAADGRFRVTTNLDLRGRETPNPHGRLYMASRPLNDGRARFFRDAAHAPPLAARLLESAHIASVLFRDNTVTVVRTDEADWDEVDRHIDLTLRRYFLHCGKALAPVERSDEDNTELENKVLAILEERVRPRVHRDGGDIELIEVVDGIVRVHMIGACSGCPASALTLKFGIEQTLKELLPGEIEAVEQIG